MAKTGSDLMTISGSAMTLAMGLTIAGGSEVVNPSNPVALLVELKKEGSIAQLEADSGPVLMARSSLHPEVSKSSSPKLIGLLPELSEEGLKPPMGEPGTWKSEGEKTSGEKEVVEEGLSFSGAVRAKGWEMGDEGRGGRAKPGDFGSVVLRYCLGGGREMMISTGGERERESGERGQKKKGWCHHSTSAIEQARSSSNNSLRIGMKFVKAPNRPMKLQLEAGPPQHDLRGSTRSQLRVTIGTNRKPSTSTRFFIPFQ